MDDRPGSPPAATPAKPRRRRGCLLLLAIMVGGLLCAGCLFTWWLRSDHDLEILRGELEARHLPTRPPDLPLQVALSGVRAKWKKLNEKPLDGCAPPNPFTPVPEILREHYAAEDQAVITGVRAAVDDLGKLPVVVRPLRDGDFFRYDVFRVASGPELILEWDLLLADHAQVPAYCHRLLGFCAILPARDAYDLDARSRVVDRALTAVAGRLDVITSSAPEVADELARIADLEIGDVHDAQMGELVGELERWSDRTKIPYGFSMSTGGAWLDSCLDRTLVPVLIRAGRATYLRHLADLVELVDPRTPPGVVVSTCLRMQEEENRLSRSGWLPSGYLYGAERFTLPGRVILDCYLESMHARLLAAVLRGQPWPEDWTDPLHGPIRPLVRGGRVVGAYALCGGPDLGGREPNIYWALYERL